MPLISVILATRNRPSLFAEALGSVLAQDFADIEIIIVDDGSDTEHLREYDAILAEAKDRGGCPPMQSHRLVHRPRGHGQAYALNFGVSHAGGQYVCFLDDDDCWIDPGHLSRLSPGLRALPQPDVIMANQVAYKDGTPLPGPIWIDELAPLLTQRGVMPRADGALPVSVDDLMALHGFCHINALAVRRAFWEQVGGMDEGIRWECDRDLFLRLVDQAGTMLHHPAVVSRHNVPNAAAGASMTTSLAALDRWLYQLRVLEKASLFARHGAIRAHGRRHKAYTLKRIAEELGAHGRWASAVHYAREALAVGPTVKWCAFTLYCMAQALRHGDGPAGDRS